MRRLIKWLRKFILENFVKGYRPINVMWDITVQIKGRPLTACTHTTYNNKVSFIKTSVLHSIPIMNSLSVMVPVIYYAAYFWSDKYFLSFLLQRAFDYCLQTEYCSHGGHGRYRRDDGTRRHPICLLSRRNCTVVDVENSDSFRRYIHLHVP